MRTLFLFLALAVVPSPPLTAEPVTVEQLEQTLSTRRLSDKELAEQLSHMELTQRLSTTRLRVLTAHLPGKRSREALLVIADSSAFLDLPPSELPSLPAPDTATQKQIVSRAVDYVASAIHRMPDFLATRRLTRFEAKQVTRGVEHPAIVETHGFHVVDRTHANVRVRGGEEVADTTPAQAVSLMSGYSNWGVFGPLLGIVMADVMKGKMGWDHWEPGPTGPLAVFRYVVSEQSSHYNVSYCRFLGTNGWLRDYNVTPQYHGELAIDPESGAVMRLVLKTDLAPSPLLHTEHADESPLTRSDVVVEYGPVEIGGSRYICPVKSISIAGTWTRHIRGSMYEVARNPGKVQSVPLDKIEYSRTTGINDFTFGDYHVFRGDMKILPEVEQRSADTSR